MAITRTTSTEDSAGHGGGLSDYEKLRMEKIKRNEERMKELGLFRSKDAIAAAAKKKSSNKTKKAKQISPEGPQRRSSRKRKTVANYSDEQVIPMYEDDEEKAMNEDYDSYDESGSNNDADDQEDYEASDNENDDDEDEEMVEERPSKRSKPIKPEKTLSSNTKAGSKSKKTAVDTTFDCINPKGGLVLEYAKTSRSSCRKCRNKIEKGRPRVGIEAWIVGRNAITWQLPKCMLQNMCCLYEKSNGGKGKCKASHTTFAKGQLKIGIRCHTATYYYRVESIGAVLANVVALMRSEKDHDNFELKVDDIDGSSKLSEKDRQTLVDILEKAFQIPDPQEGTVIPEETKSAIESKAVKKEPEIEEKKTNRKPSTREQPKLGAKIGAKGRVEWKFGGRSCYGSLIPRMETKTHCYARTHKGNVKTLAKGKDYWTMLD